MGIKIYRHYAICVSAQGERLTNFYRRARAVANDAKNRHIGGVGRRRNQIRIPADRDLCVLDLAGIRRK
jgi:hypothetical protein